MEGFLTFVLVFILIVWLIGRFFPLLLAWWIRRKFGKINRDQKRYSKQQQSRYKEGDVIVEIEREEKKIVDNNVGEYIDYEETKK
ncbi:MAG: hypothetical protein WCR71_03435 [Bacteroidales bacterium]